MGETVDIDGAVRDVSTTLLFLIVVGTARIAAWAACDVTVGAGRVDGVIELQAGECVGNEVFRSFDMLQGEVVRLQF
jgi:hypothetical protein